MPGELSIWRDGHFIQLVLAHKFCAGSGLKGWRADQTCCVYSLAHTQVFNIGHELRIRRLLTSVYKFTKNFYCHPWSLLHAEIMSLIFSLEIVPACYIIKYSLYVLPKSVRLIIIDLIILLLV